MKKIVIATIATLTATSALMAAPVNGKACASCHGANFEKAAMGKSKIVSDMTHAEIAESLKNYKNVAGFGHSPMKGAMAGQVKKYSDAELEAFAQTIGK
jgi:cytochrome c-type protein NapB